ncbi:MAG: hypothetical protein ACFWT6_12030 [Virgibacillus proomii]|jgi:hypothetical protein
MSYVFERHSEKIEIEQVRRNFMKFETINRVRKDIPNCELCSKPFKANDNTNLAFIKKKENYLVCDECANMLINGGAKSV